MCSAAWTLLAEHVRSVVLVECTDDTVPLMQTKRYDEVIEEYRHML